MKKDAFRYENTGSGLLMIALALAVMQFGIACDSANNLIWRVATIFLPLPVALLTLPWTAQCGIFTRQGLTVCWGRLLRASYSWDDLLWTTNVEKQNQGGAFRATIHHKKAPNPIHPLYHFFLLDEGVEKGCLYRAASGRKPDKGILPRLDNSGLSMVILTEEERERYISKRMVSYYLLCCITVAIPLPLRYYLAHFTGWGSLVGIFVGVLMMVGVGAFCLIRYMTADEKLILDAIYHFNKEEAPHDTEKALL